MIDLHCHLLPGLDDGAEDQAMALAMAQAAAEAGVREIVCTPHCTAGDPAMGSRIVYIRQMVETLRQEMARQKLPIRLYPGMELLCNRHLPRVLERGELLTLADSPYLLIEFSFTTSLANLEWAIHLVRQGGYRPVLAHPERYPAVWQQPDRLANWFFEGVVLQLDKDSVLGRFGRFCARTADWALRHGFAHVIASDAHDLTHRTIRLERVRTFVAQHYSPWYADVLLLQNPRQILAGEELIPPEQNG